MEKTLENKFIEPYRYCGVVSDCIDYMRHHYDLGFSQQKKNLPDKWNNYYNVVLPKQIKERYDMCDNGGVNCFNSPLMNEVEANLCECKSDAEQKRYLYSLLTPFKEMVSVYNPIAEIKQIEGRIEELNANREIWESCISTDERAKAQIEACESEVAREQGNIELYTRISNEFRRLTGQFCEGAKWMQEGTVEQCISDFWCNAHGFGIRLYALLLTYGIDYMAIQKECGIYLVNRVHVTDIEDFIGTRELAQEYLNKLHTQPQTEEPAQSTPAPQLPKKLNENQITTLYRYLINNDWIETIDKDSFNYIFGGDCVHSTNSITWSKSKTKQHLREMLKVIYTDYKPFSKIERVVEQVFIYNGGPMKLAKPKATPSIDSDNLKNFLATLLNP